MFSAEELTAFQNVIRYILLRRLESSFTSVQSDLIALHNALRGLNADVTLNYQIDFFGAKVSVYDVHLAAEQQIEVTQSLLTAEDLSQPELKAILTDTALTDSLKFHFSTEIQLLGMDDIGKVSQQVEAIKTDQEMDSQIGVEGKGGSAHIHIVKRSVAQMKAQIVLNYGWAVVVCIVLFIVASATLGGHRPSIVPLLIAGFIGVPVIMGLIGSAKRLKSDLDNYEHRRSKVFAADKSR